MNWDPFKTQKKLAKVYNVVPLDLFNAAKRHRREGEKAVKEREQKPVHEMEYPNLFIVHTLKDKRLQFLPHYSPYKMT